MWGATKNNTGGTGKNLNMRGHTKFLGGLKKLEGARLSGGLLQRGVKLQIMKKVKIRISYKQITYQMIGMISGFVDPYWAQPC